MNLMSTVYNVFDNVKCAFFLLMKPVLVQRLRRVEWSVYLRKLCS